MKFKPQIDITSYFSITIFSFLFVGLIFASPLLINSGNRVLLGIGAGFYNLATWFCHQLSERSLFLWGTQLPFDARMTGIFTGGLVGLLSPFFVPWRRLIWPAIVAAVFVVPLAIDGVSQSILLMRESNNFLRLLTGSLAGFGLFALLAFVLLRMTDRRLKTVLRQTTALKAAIYSNLLIVILVIGLAFPLGGKFVSKDEALSLAGSVFNGRRFAVTKIYWLPPNTTLAIPTDPYVRDYDDVILRDIKDRGGLYPSPAWFELYIRPFIAPHGSWLVVALKQIPPSHSRKSTFFRQTPGEYVYIDSFSGRIVARITH